MTIDELIEFVETNSISEVNREKITLLLEAVNDWPGHPETIDAFFKEVKNFLQIDELTYETINSRMKAVHPIDSSCQLEALTSLLQLEDKNKSESVDVTVRRLLTE